MTGIPSSWRALRGSPTVRRVLPWAAGWLTLQGVLLGARWALRRRDEGDESSAGIRRVRVLDEVTLRPHNPLLSRVRLDLLLAGGHLDLTGVERVPGGIDLTVHALAGGIAVTVPKDWRIWVDSRGPGGVGTEDALRRTQDDKFADLRVHTRLVFAGIAIEAGESTVGHAG